MDYNLNNIRIQLISNKEKGLFSTEDGEIGRLIYTFNPQYVEQPTRTSIQCDGKHFEDGIGRYLNHHCEPNTSIASDNRGVHLVAIDFIKKNDELTFNYNTTESMLANPFRCKCHGYLIRGKGIIV